MPRPLKKTMVVYNFVLATMETLYEEKYIQNKGQKTFPKFETKKALADYILDRSEFLTTEDHSDDPTKWAGEKIVCRTTVNNAINMLIDDNLIALGNNGYEYVPHLRDTLESFPILEIAPQTPISIGVPENILFLTVGNGFANQVAEYLSAQFHKGDILFIPLGNFIMCIGVLPKSVISGSTARKEANPEQFRIRIESVLYMFKLSYPSFEYGYSYEVAFAAHNNPTIKGYFRAMAHRIAEQKTAKAIIEEQTASEAYGSVLAGLEYAAAIDVDTQNTEPLHEMSQDTEQEDLSLRDQIDFFFDDRFDELIEP